jgi:DNA-binding transcriptional ArsR family regulator
VEAAISDEPVELSEGCAGAMGSSVVSDFISLSRVLFLGVLMSGESRSDLTVIESKLKGKTLRVYWYLLRSSNQSAGVREIQRALRFSSPSIAYHHLDKLQNLGLVTKKVTGDYVLAEEVKVGLLRFFTRIGRFLVPRYLFYSVWLSTMLVTYIVLYGLTGSVHNFFALTFGTLGCAVLWFETVKLWREKPF